MTIFNGLFKQSCTCTKGYDKVHEGDVWKFYMKILKIQQKIGKCHQNRDIGHFWQNREGEWEGLPKYLRGRVMTDMI